MGSTSAVWVEVNANTMVYRLKQQLSVRLIDELMIVMISRGAM